jgi:hypothetical protein
MRLPLFWLFFCALCICTHTSATSAPLQQYTNSEYGYSLILPPGVHAIENLPPAPQHGIAIDLQGGAKIWIDGSYDAMFHGSAQAALLQLLTDEGVHPVPLLTLTKLANLPAAAAQYRKAGKFAIRIIAFRPRGDAVPILYTLALDADATQEKAAKRQLRQIQMRFSLRALPR